MNDLFDLTGKTALITGASSGLGEQFAKVLSKAGARVILTARRLDKLKSIANKLDNSLTIEMDVSNKQSVSKVFQEIEKAGEKIDICINNAGIAEFTPVFSDDDQCVFESVIQTNLMGVWYVTNMVSIHMKSHGIKGSIINIGSVNGDHVPAKEGAAYSVSKAAVIHLTKTLVGELSPYQIRINCISPGWFKTPMNSSDLSHMHTLIPYGNIAEPNDMDGLILYLASNTASQYVTGVNFTIDGGISWGGLSW